MTLSPFSHINDGLFEVAFYDRHLSIGELQELVSGTRKGGLHAYDPKTKFYRTRNAKFINKEYLNDGSKKLLYATIDGECLEFRDQAKLEIIPKGIKYICSLAAIAEA